MLLLLVLLLLELLELLLEELESSRADEFELGRKNGAQECWGSGVLISSGDIAKRSRHLCRSDWNFNCSSSSESFPSATSFGNSTGIRLAGMKFLARFGGYLKLDMFFFVIEALIFLDLMHYLHASGVR